MFINTNNILLIENNNHLIVSIQKMQQPFYQMAVATHQPRNLYLGGVRLLQQSDQLLFHLLVDVAVTGKRLAALLVAAQ